MSAYIKVKIPTPQHAKPGWSFWIEHGQWYSGPKVDRIKFGKHDYDDGGFERGIHKCKCGCHMSGFNSFGPVDPFGACPENPHK